MRLLRAVVRLLIVSAITLFLTAAWTLGRVLYAPFPVRRARLRRRVVKVWATMLCGVMGIRVHVTGRPPDPPFILVANHLSYIDVLVFHSLTECVQIARADMGSWPVIGFLARYFGTLFIDRSLARDVVRVSDLIRAEIRAGNGVTFFPEGTSTRGAAVNRFKSSLLEFPAAEAFPVHTASLRYETGPGEAPASETVCWWGDAAFVPHAFRLFGVRSIRAEVTFAAEVVTDSDRKRLTRQLQASVEQHFVPTE